MGFPSPRLTAQTGAGKRERRGDLLARSSPAGLARGKISNLLITPLDRWPINKLYPNLGSDFLLGRGPHKMSHVPRGVRLSLSPARKMSIETLTHAQRVPSAPMARSLNVSAVAAARQALNPAPSWTTIFVRAYGLVCRDFAPLRRAFMPWPRPHLYEHPHSTCALIVERSWQDETILLGSKIRAPEDLSLAAIQQRIRYYKETPVWEIGDYRQVLRFGRLPWLLRRFAF